MNLAEIREKITIFLIPILIIGVVLGGLVALVGKTYFWDVSRLTLRVPGESPIEVRIDIQARLVYFDADLFGFYYPVHFTVPFSRTQSCLRECTLDRLPAGDAVITFFNTNIGTTAVFIEPDTQGVLDVRPAFEVKNITDTKIIDTLRAPLITEEARTTMNIEKNYPLIGLAIVRRNKEILLYDVTTRQLMTPPITKVPFHVARGDRDGVYIFWTAEGAITWDRYGRTPIQTRDDMTVGQYTFSWKS